MSATLIDNIFTTILQPILVPVLSSLITDHYPIFLTQQKYRPNNVSLAPTIKSRQIRPTNSHGLKNAISLVDWQIVTNNSDPEVAYNKLTTKLLSFLIFIVH